MKPIALSDEQLTAIMRAAAPLPPADRRPFLEEVTRELQSQPTIGDGVVGRVCAELQRAYLQPPMVFERRIPNVQPAHRQVPVADGPNSEAPPLLTGLPVGLSLG